MEQNYQIFSSCSGEATISLTEPSSEFSRKMVDCGYNRMGWWGGEKVSSDITWDHFLKFGGSGYLCPFAANDSISIVVHFLLLQKLATPLFLVIESQDIWQTHQELQGKPGDRFKDEVVHAYSPVVNDRSLHIPFLEHCVCSGSSSYHSFACFMACFESEDNVRTGTELTRCCRVAEDHCWPSAPSELTREVG